MHKLSGVWTSINCQEYGHTWAYCSLRTEAYCMPWCVHTPVHLCIALGRSFDLSIAGYKL